MSKVAATDHRYWIWFRSILLLSHCALIPNPSPTYPDGRYDRQREAGTGGEGDPMAK